MGFLYSQFFVTPKIPTEPLDGQTLIITGSNTGLGYAAAEHIARLKPAKLILAVRNLEKGENAKQKLVKQLPAESKTSIEVWQLNMSSNESVLAFADRCKNDLDRLDAVSLNAGIQAGKLELVEGHESTIKVNVISTFLLALALEPVLLTSAKKHNITPRLSIVASEVHAWATFAEKKTPQGQSLFKALSANQPNFNERYMTSKLIQVLIFRQMKKPIVERDGSQVIWNILNPGFCYSELDRDQGGLASLFTRLFRAILARTTEMGGRPVAAGIVAGKESDWQYMHDGIVADEALSKYVKSREGEEMGVRLWSELKTVLSEIRPELVKDL